MAKIILTPFSILMKIINLNKKCVLAEEVILANSFLKRAKGLLGYSSLGTNQAMILRPSNSVHTFFMRFPIDVLFVGKDNLVLAAVTNMRPFRVTGIFLKSAFVIELPAGIIKSTGTSKGDLLQIS